MAGRQDSRGVGMPQILEDKLSGALGCCERSCWGQAWGRCQERRGARGQASWPWPQPGSPLQPLHLGP